MPSSKPEDQPEADSVEREAARAVSEFLEARNANPQVSPAEFAPGLSQAAEAFWKAVEGAGALVGNLG